MQTKRVKVESSLRYALENHGPEQPLLDIRDALERSVGAAGEAKLKTAVFSRPSSHTSPSLRPFFARSSLSAANLYPAGIGSAPIRRTMLPNKRRVKCKMEIRVECLSPSPFPTDRPSYGASNRSRISCTN